MKDGKLIYSLHIHVDLKIYNELATCLYTQVIVTKLPVYPHKHFLAFFTAHCKHVGTVMPLPTHK